MAADTVVRVLALCVVLAGAETLHGIARTVLVVPRIGKARALKLSALSGSFIALCICWLLVPPLGLAGAAQHLWLGLLLAAWMAAFDLALGRWLLKKPWRRLWPDFDPRTGNYLLLGLLVLAAAPLLVHAAGAGRG